MDNYHELHNYLKIFLEAYGHLKRLGVVNNKKDFTCQLGEFLVAELFDGKLAESSTQKDWDVQFSNGNRVQIKTQCKDFCVRCG